MRMCWKGSKAITRDQWTLPDTSDLDGCERCKLWAGEE